MKKISDRAVELMLERHKAILSPKEGQFEGCDTWFDYMQKHYSGYPHARHVSQFDLAQALDEFQADVMRAIGRKPPEASEPIDNTGTIGSRKTRIE